MKDIKDKSGFAPLDEDRKREIVQPGGKATHEKSGLAREGQFERNTGQPNLNRESDVGGFSGRFNKSEDIE